MEWFTVVIEREEADEDPFLDVHVTANCAEAAVALARREHGLTADDSRVIAVYPGQLNNLWQRF